MSVPGATRIAYTPERLLAVAVEVFNLRGYDGTSMEDLARATGITKSSIYHHVRSKEELLRLAVSRALDRIFAVLDQPAARTGRAIDRLEHVVRASARVLVDELPYVTLLLRVRGNTATEQWGNGNGQLKLLFKGQPRRLEVEVRSIPPRDLEQQTVRRARRQTEYDYDTIGLNMIRLFVDELRYQVDNQTGSMRMRMVKYLIE